MVKTSSEKNTFTIRQKIIHVVEWCNIEIRNILVIAMAKPTQKIY